MMVAEKIFSKIHILLFKLQGMDISFKVGLRYGIDVPRLRHKVKIGRFTSLDRGVSMVLTSTLDNKQTKHLIELGDRVYINRYTSIDATNGIIIEDEVMIGPHCYITDHDHSFQENKANTPKGELPLLGAPTKIERNVWIGSNVVILKGVTIGKNSVIGAGSVVTKSVPSNVVAVGNPCRVVKELIV